ncbi:MAG: phytoene/squalene synthase family protein, partial [Beijerinckiaceae bacterium]
MDTVAAGYAEAAALVAAHDPDRHTAALFAPADRRQHLHALHAFCLEIAAVRARVSEAVPGEIRLQWWREALSGERAGEAAANPLSAALLATIAANRLPLQPFLDLIDARVFDLYDDPMPDQATLDGYLAETTAAPIRLAGLILGSGDDLGGAEAAGHAGMALGLVTMLQAFPWHARRGQVLLPATLLSAVGITREDIVAGRDGDALRAALSQLRGYSREHLQNFNNLRRDLDQRLIPAFLPLALLEPYLKAMERRNYHPFEAIIDTVQWRRIWRY